MTDTTQRPATGEAAHNGRATYPWLSRYPANVDWGQRFPAEPLHRLLEKTVQRFPANVCTNFIGRTLTYAEIGALVDRAAAGLQKLGVKKGTRVGLFLPNSPTFIVFYNAILKAGGTVVNFNPLYTHDELTYQIRDSGTELMVTLDLKVLFAKVEALILAGTLPRAVVASFRGLLPTAKSVLFRLFKGKELSSVSSSPVKDKLIAEASLLDNDGKPAPVDIEPLNDIAVLQYTGGTTGTPKGAMLTHANVFINVHQALAWVPGLEPGKERVLGALPFFHVFAMTGVMNFGLATGAEIVIMPRFVLNDAMALITKTRPTIMPGVPTMFIAMLSHPKLKSFDLSSLKFCLSGGAPLLLSTKTEFERLTGCKVVEAYGLSESSPAVTINPLDGPVKEMSIGQPIPGTIVSLRDPADPVREVALGEKGEITIKGPQVMKGYWNKPEETRNQMTVDGYLRTGDIAYMDSDGFLFIVDRIKDLIICSGYNVYPRAIEEAVSSHPAVEEVTVIGIADQYRGEAPKAFIKLRAGTSATREDILAHLKTRLNPIEMPAEIEFRDALPKTMIGKLSKKELRAEELAKVKAAAAPRADRSA